MTLIESQKTPSKARLFESSPGDEADWSSSLKTRWINRRLLKGPALPPVFFVGESPSRALPIALATMRGSIDGIWASSLHKVPLRGINELLTELRTRLDSYDVGTDQYVWEKYHEFERHVLRRHDIYVSETSTILERFFLQIDATKLHEDDMETRPENHTRPPTANIWFQCPWVLNGDLSRLLKDFVTSASKIQHYGDVIFLGLTSHPRYRDRYKLEESKFWQHTRQLGYDRCVIQGKGVDILEPDQKFIQECIKYGYRHSSESSENIHAYIRDHHVTHVLIKRTRLGGDSLPSSLISTIIAHALSEGHHLELPGSFSSIDEDMYLRSQRLKTLCTLACISRKWNKVVRSHLIMNSFQNELSPWDLHGDITADCCVDYVIVFIFGLVSGLIICLQ